MRKIKLPLKMLLPVLAALSLVGQARAATSYWDPINGSAAGTGSPTPGGTWDAATAAWGDAAGTAVPLAWVDYNHAHFAAGTDAIGTYTVTVSGTQNINSLSVDLGSVTLTGGGLNLGNPGGGLAGFTNASSSTLTFQNITINQGFASGIYIQGGTTSVGSGATLTDSGGIFVLGNGTATTFNQTAGSVGVGGNTVYIANGGTGTGAAAATVNLSGGTFTGGTTYVGVRDTATLKISGGTTTLGTLSLAYSAAVTPGTVVSTVDLDGGILALNQAGKGGVGAYTTVFNFNGGTLQARIDNASFMVAGLTRANVRNGGAVIDTNGRNITIGQALVHSSIGGDNATDGGLTKIGAGTLTLTGANTYTGATILGNNCGTLVVGNGTGAGSLSASSACSIGTGSTLEFTHSNSQAIGNAISGAGTLLFLGTNASNNTQSDYTLSGNNSAFSGAMVVDSARIRFSAQSQAGTATITLKNTGQLFNATAGLALSNDIVIDSSETGWTEGTAPNMLGMIRPDAALTLSGSITINNSRLQIGAAAATYGNAATTLSGAVGGTGGLYQAASGGVVVLSGASANTYSGLTDIYGTIHAQKSAGVVAIGGDINLRNNNSVLDFNANNQLGGTGIVTDSGGGSNYGYFHLMGTTQTVGGLSCSDGRLVIQNSQAIGGGTASNTTGTLTIAPALGQTYTTNGYVRDGFGANTGVLNIVKSGAGTQVFAGTNITYSGSTTVSNGVLRVASHVASVPGTTASYAVGTGATQATLSGAAATSTINIGTGASNTVTIGSNGFITAGSDEFSGTVGTLNITANKLSLAGTYLVDLNYTGGFGNRASGAGGEADLLSITGDFDGNGLKFDLRGTNAPLASGTHYAIKILEFSGTGSNLDGYSVAGLDTASGQSVVRWGNAYYLVPEPASFALLALGSLLLLRRPSRRRRAGGA